MQLLIRKEFNKFIILQILLCQVFVTSLTFKSLSSYLIALKTLSYVAFSIY